MSLESPLLASHLARGATTLAWTDPADPARLAEVVDTFGPLELEYAALRKHCVLLDTPHRASIAVRGDDRLEFLNRMLTQELKDLQPWHCRRSFWLNRKGRIDADLRVANLDDEIRFHLDAHAVPRTLETLRGYLFAEDVALEDLTEATHTLELHGPTGALLLGALAEPVSGPAPSDLRPGQACTVRIDGCDALIEREDTAGEIGLTISCDTSQIPAVYEALCAAGALPAQGPGGDPPEPTELASRVRLRGAGWHAWNIARIESGTPVFQIDFGASNLPHETGVLDSRVSFKKGCYLGQEVVARMQSLGHPKQRLVALRFEGDTDPGLPQPVTGSQICAPANPDKSVGQVTSSTISPMLGAAPVCLAMVRFAESSPGTEVLVEADGRRLGARVQERLAFWRRGEGA